MTKQCKVCNEPNPNPLEKTCSYVCRGKWLLSQDGEGEIKKALRAAERARKRKERKRKAEAKGIQHWLKETQKVFNAYIRERDKGLGCISCGTHAHMMGGSGLGGVIDAGHFKSVGAHPELRFEPKNVHAQCRDCNGFKGGMPKEYAAGIIKRFGQGRLDWLNGKHEAKHYTIEQLADMRKGFRKATRELRAKREFQ